jgi:serine/threonine-protein kinase
MGAWVLDKQKPLGAILVARGALSAADCALLEPMVARHIQMHGGDPEQSLAAISAVGSAREALGAVADGDVQASVAHMGAASERTAEDLDRTATHAGASSSADDPDRTATCLGTSTSTGTRFRILRLHDRGGLGEVFVARDEELHREVALKQIKDEHADDAQRRARFLVEAEITGGLEHPGIVPVYGLGQYENGRPFYAMRFIRGDNLKAAIARFHQAEVPGRDAGERALELRRLLGRFLDVCNALEYAHSRGVLHRDLKPGNIMLGQYGETLVVDWGLAKSAGRPDPTAQDSERRLQPQSGSDVHPTETGARVGTPAFMSPEQASGRLDALGPASDVYSLGATLYCLLTGKAPFDERDLAALLRKVERGEFPPPRAVNARVDRALEAICLKAMARVPGERYAAPRLLAEDVERWLADERVRAYREPWARTLARWLTRHRTGVTAAAAALLMGLVGLGSVAAVQTKARHDLAQKNTALDEQRRRAEDREQQAIDAVKRFGDAVTRNPDLKDNPALEPLRKELLREPLGFFKALRERLQSDRDTRPAALHRLADAASGLSRLTDEIGDKRDALEASEEALAIFERLAREHPSDTEYQGHLASSHNSIGNLLGVTGRTDEALEAYTRALAICERLARENPAVAEWQHALAESHHNIGLLLSVTGRLDAALEPYTKALALRERLAREHPSVTGYQSDLADIHNKVGNVLSATGRPDSALEAHTKALAVHERLAREGPSVTTYQSRLADSYNDMGNLLSVTGRLDAALEPYTKGLALHERLAREHPSVVGYQKTLAANHNNIGALLGATGRSEAALESYTKALAIRERLAREHPSVTEYHAELASNHFNIGSVLNEMGRPEAALESYSKALVIRERLALEHSTVTEYQAALARTHRLIGYLLRGRSDAALAAFAKALAIQERLVREHPSVTDYQKELALSHNEIGGVLRGTGRSDAALEAYTKAGAIQERLAREHPESPDHASELGGTLNNLATLDLHAKRYEPARTRLREAVTWQKKALAANPRHPRYRRFLASHLRNLIKANQGLGLAAEAGEALRDLEALKATDPRLADLDARLAAVSKGEAPKDNAARLALAQRAYETARHALAARLWAEALDADPRLADDRQAQHRYNAACAAALAGSGQAKDDPPPDAAAQARLRAQALGWLKAELAIWTTLLETARPEQRAGIVQFLQHWQQDGDLAGVRDAKAIDALPESEREAWRTLWRDVAAALGHGE